MKKKIALLLAAVMVAAMVPVSAFATTDNHVDRVAVVAVDAELGEDAPVLKIDDREFNDLEIGDQFYVELTGAEWPETITTSATDGNIEVEDAIEVTRLSATLASFEILKDYTNDETIQKYKEVPKYENWPWLGTELVPDGDPVKVGPVERYTISFAGVKVTGEEAKATIDPNYSGISAGTYTFAVTTTKNATVKIAGVVNVPVEGGAVALKDITISETIKGAVKESTDEKEEFAKVRLYGEFKFDDDAEVTGKGTNGLGVLDVDYSDDCKEAYIKFDGDSTAPGKLVISGLAVEPTKDTEGGDVAEIVISGAGIEKTTLEVAKAVEYGLTFTAEDKAMPVFYSGRYADKAALKVTIKETAPKTWWTSRKTTITLPEGVEFANDNTGNDPKAVVITGSKNFAKDRNEKLLLPELSIDENVLTLKGGTIKEDACGEITLEFMLSFDPNFVGDVVAVLDGPAVPEVYEATIAEVAAPITFDVYTSDVSIDYRNVAVGDIVIREAFAGALAKGDTLKLSVDKYIDLEDGVKFVIEEGDIKLDASETDGDLVLKVTRESYKVPAVVKVTNVKAYLDRTLPAGEYCLDLVLSNAKVVEGKATGEYDKDVEAYYQNYSATKNATGTFTTKSLCLAEDYINVVTAGRDQDDSTFTTSVAIVIGANTMTVGNAVLPLDVPAYISGGYTMLPVRAVATALSSDGSTVLWDDATKTVTIAFGARIIGMTIGSKVMNINGVAVAMTAAPEITNGRTFLPVRDLAYALGLTDADIDWNDETKTVTLN